MSNDLNELEAIELIYNYIINSDKLAQYCTDNNTSIYTDVHSDLADIELDGEKGLPTKPIFCMSMDVAPQNPDRNSSFVIERPLIFAHVVVPHKDRKTSYSKSFELAKLIGEIVNEDLNLDENEDVNIKLRVCQVDRYVKIGSKRFGEKGVYSPQQINFKVELK